MRISQKLASIAQRLKWPAICTLCNQYHPTALALCPACLAHIKPAGIACSICANPLNDGVAGLCGSCIQQKPWFDEAWIPCPFEEPLRSLIHQFKYQQSLYLTGLLTHLMLKVLPVDIKPDCLIPVPLHPERMKMRGFNQAALLARNLSRKTGIACDLYNSHKIIHTKPQAGLSRKTRLLNLRQVFTVKPIQAKHIVIVDDLMTTGSTVNGLSRLFKEQGVERISVWCCARTVF